MSTTQNDYSRTLTKPVETTLATVNAVPGGVYVELDLKTQTDELTPEQARAFAAMLIDAADDAEHIDFASEEVDDLTLVDDRQ